MNRCYYCMSEIESGLMTCPHCGKRVDQYPSDPRYLKPGTVLQGKYTVGAVLGSGGFGITYVGWDATLDRKIAIKEYYPRQYGRRKDDGNTVTASAMNATDKFGAGLDRFLQEAKSLRELHGVDGVVEVDNFFRENGTGYIVMEFLEGRDLRTIIKEKNGIVDYEWCRKTILTVLYTLDKIHGKGILHRDIAPDNIYVTNEGVVKLIDFGAARHEEIGIEAENGDSLVKPGYSPIEQYESVAPQGPYTDLYATAALMYYMLTGEKPASAIDRKNGAAIDAPSDKGIIIPEKAEMGMMMCLNVMPEHRLDSAKDFMETLDGKDFSPYSESVQQSVVKKEKKQKKSMVPILVASLVSLAVVVVAGLITGLGLFGNKNDSQENDQYQTEEMADSDIDDSNETDSSTEGNVSEVETTTQPEDVTEENGQNETSYGDIGLVSMPTDIKYKSIEDAIDSIRSTDIDNKIIVKYSYNRNESEDVVSDVVPGEGEELHVNQDIEITVSSNHIATLGLNGGKKAKSIIGMDADKVDTILDEAGVSSSESFRYWIPDENQKNKKYAYNRLLKIKGISFKPKLPGLSVYNNVVFDNKKALIGINKSEVELEKFYGTKSDYRIKQDEFDFNTDNITFGNSKNKIKKTVATNLVNILAKRPHMKKNNASKAAFKYWKNELINDIKKSLVISIERDYNAKYDDGEEMKDGEWSGIRFDPTDPIDINPIGIKDRKIRIVVIFNKK